MIKSRIVGAAIALLLSSSFGFAGPCTNAIDRIQVQADAAIEAQAESGPSVRESGSALLNHQPTPGSIAKAEEAAGEGAGPARAVAALARAREADRAGNLAACENELHQARQALGL
jgi:hypothetical protein